MFEGYQVKSINNEEILYLHLNPRFEFNKAFAKGKNKEHLLKRVENYIIKNNISFHGVKVFFVISGVIITSIIIPPNASSFNPIETNYGYISRIVDTNNAPSIINESSYEKINIEETKDNETKETVIQKDSSKEIATKTNSSNTKTNESLNKKNTQTKSKSNATSSSSTVSSSKQDNSNSSNTQTEAMVTVNRTNGTILNLTMTDYLIGVVAAEMPALFHAEALKAQAVIARTYASKLIKEGKKLTDSVSTQAYKDNNQLKKEWGSSYNTYYHKIKQAVEATKDEVILYNNALIDAVYHSTSNGKTTDSVDVWGNKIPYLKSVDSHWDKLASSYLKEDTKNFDVISMILGVSINSESEIKVLSTTSNNSVKEIKINNKTFTGLQIRTLLGLRSTDFDFILNDLGITIITRGYGHGVGMSQYGANGMAKEGYNYQQIIKHYYSGVTISKK